MPSMDESLAIPDLADHLYEYLPGNPHPYASAEISFPGVASKLGLSQHWPGGGKRAAIASLLTGTVTYDRGRFCDLILSIVKTALIYRRNKTPLCREDIEHLNKIVLRFGFKIPELHDQKFFDGLPRRSSTPSALSPAANSDSSVRTQLQQRLIGLSALKPQERGFAFERFLGEMCEAYGLSPRSSFRLVGEQIDGSMTLDGEFYLLEAKWQDAQTGVADLLTFAGKVSGKSTWARGVFLSYSGFTADGLEAFARGRATNIICVDGFDLYEVLNRPLDLRDVLRAKLRRAAETSRAYVGVRELFP